MANLRIHYLGTSSPHTDQGLAWRVENGMIIISIPRQTSCNEEEVVGLQGLRIVNGKVHGKDRDVDIIV